MAAHPLRRAATHTISIEKSQGRTLAAPVRANESVPPFSRSRVDGYAVIAADVARATRQQPARLVLAGEVVMGAIPRDSIGPGCAMRVPTGGALPRGADSAVMLEDAAEEQSSVLVYDGKEALENVTLLGADVLAGAELFEAGTVITPARIGLLAGAGVSEVVAFEPPRVGLLLTGDELVAPGQTMRAGQIRDINRYSLSAALVAMGFAPVQYDGVPDEREAYAAALMRALAECDAVVVSGGSSAGERDYTPDVVAQAGKPGVVVHHIRAKPGRPTLLGVVGDQPIIGLPGNPVSALVILETVGKPILLRMLGREANDIPTRAMLDAVIDVSKHLEHRIPVRLRATGGDVRAYPLFGTSAQMHILGFADALVTVPLGAGRIEAGTIVDAIPLSATIAVR